MSDLVLSSAGVLAEAVPVPGRGRVEVEGLLQRTARYLVEFDLAKGTAAAYAQDLGIAYVVHEHGLQELVDRLEPPGLREILRGRRPTHRAAAPDLCWYPACLAAGLDPIEDVDAEHVKLWVAAQGARRRPDAPGHPLLSKDARHRRLSVTSSLLDWAFEQGLADANPAARVNRRRAGLVLDRHHSSTARLSGRQFDLLLYAADHYPTAIRLAELAAVRMWTAASASGRGLLVGRERDGEEIA